MTFGKLLAATLFAAALPVAAQPYSFTNNVNAPVPDANPTGLTSTMDISGVFGTITNVTVTLNISGGRNGDLYGYLQSDNGGFAVLLNRVGKTSTDPIGYDDAGFSITLSDFALSDIHLYGGNAGNPLSGSWQPDGRDVDPQLTLDTDSRTAFLSSFNNINPNTTWTLFLSDFVNDSESTLQSWSISFMSVPEPSAAALAGVGTLMLIFTRRKSRRSPAN